MIAPRLTDSPAVQRIAAWWSGLSQRERIMVGGLGVVLTGLVLVLGVIQPLHAARTRALADIRTYDMLKARVAAAGALGPSGPPPRTGPPVTIITNAATGFGLTIQTEAVLGGIRATVSEGSYDAVMNWLADIARNSSLSVTRVDLGKGGTPGTVGATVEFRE
ncbi:type II secretion system protein GspM [Sphingomonas sp.]|uniref:type II secretion system protein GspM n=1 Tax=Sphingomonas sp. TaxID=28214 RepID=UPI002C645632|nr:type II secretion system protein GspM [Sphingomonas sp.]HWK35535.1 type II secretion system protein GspM [Sphingomonas sp.]